MPLRKMNIDRKLILDGASKVSSERKVSYYRWIIRVCKAGVEIVE
jgi:hypothetical protein